MFKDPLHWFPDPYFSTILAVLVFSTYIIDYAIPKMIAQRQAGQPNPVHDRFSFWVIQAVSVLSIGVEVACRYLNWAVTPASVQYVGLFLIPASLAYREWAILKLGRFFSRTVQLEPGHRLITNGPYRRIRHPAYTGMILVYPGIALALGTWIGAAAALILMLGATIYRISVEEKMLLEAFGEEYRDYMSHTWRLFPGW